MTVSPSSIVASDVCVDLGGVRVLDQIDLAVHPHSRIGIVGRNGSGKTTLLEVLAGSRRPDAGVVKVTPANTSIALVRQNRDRTSERVLDMLRRRAGVSEAQRRFDAAIVAMSADRPDAAAEYELALEAWLGLDAASFDAAVTSVLATLGLDAIVADQTTASLSGGQAALVEIASVTMMNSQIVLLDEPTNDLDQRGLALLDDWVSRHVGGLVVVSHDRAFLERTVTSIFELDPKTRSGRSFEGGWNAYVECRDTMRREQSGLHAAHLAEKRRLAERAQQRREWADRGKQRARKRPADGDKHRRRAAFDQTEKLDRRAATELRRLDRLPAVEKPWEEWRLEFTIAAAKRSGTIVAEFDAATLRRGAFTIGPIDLSVRAGERIAVIGPNGSGKSTVIDGLVSRIDPERGTVRIGPSVVIGELDQWRRTFAVDGEPILDWFSEQTRLFGAEARALLAKFGVDQHMIKRSAHDLSPGERSRVQLAEFQARGVNLLVLDEPTNHLDIEAIEQVESALRTYDGALVVVSHDERFLGALDVDRVVDVTSFERGHGGGG